MLAFAAATPLLAARAPVLHPSASRAPSRAVHRRRPSPRATLLPPPPAALDGLLLLSASELYAQIARGGVGIIMSGVVGAVVVGFLMKRNYDYVRTRRRAPCAAACARLCD